MAGVVCPENSTLWFNGAQRQVQRVNISIAASQTDASIVAAAGTGIKIYVLGFRNNAGATASTFVLNTKPGGAGSAISPVFTPANNGMYGIDPELSVTVCNTNANEGLSATTGAGSTTVGVVWYFTGP